MQKILVPATGEVRKITSRKNGAEFYVQRVGLLGSDGLATAFEVLHGDASEVLKAGTYTLGADALYVNKTGNLAVSTRNLVPVGAVK